MAAPAKRAIFVGAVGHNLNADDVARVGLNLVHVALDTALKLPGPKDQPDKVEEADTSAVQNLGLEDAEQMTAPAVRAALFVKLVELATARSPPRAEVLNFLVALLNADVLPALPAAWTDAGVLERLVGFFYGSGASLHPAGTTFAAALEKAQIVPPKLSPLERAAVIAGSAPSLALLCLSLAASKRLLGVADCIAALSCETLQSNVLCFEAESMEACPHKFELQTASDLSAFLEGSKQVNPRKGGATPRSVAALPQIHGRAREAAQVATTATGVELNAVSAGVSAKAVRAPGSTAVANAAASLLSALAAVGSASASRSAALEGAAVAETADGRVADVLRSEAGRIAGSLAGILADADEARPPTLDAPAALAAALPKLVQLLTHELAKASRPLVKAEEEAAAAAGGDAAAGAAGAAGAPAADGKEKKKGKGSQGPALGKGTALVLRFARSGERLDLLSPAVEALLEAAKDIVASNANRRKPKIPKGTRDFLPEQMAIREKAFGAIVGVFKRHGAVALDTPVFELRETLMGKYGEDSKLIYDLADQGGEILSLRYDLTVPFARYLAMHNVGNIKRYHIARVYRRDNPQMNRGRFREFYQCDFDIAGAYPTMMADAEVLKVMTEILSELNIGSFCVRLNDRRLLDAIFEVAGIPQSKFRTVCSSVDKLDKEPWEEVRREIIEEKGLAPEMADAVGRFVQLKSPIGSPRELLALLQGPDSPYKGNAGAAAALAEMDLLFGYLEALRALPFVQFDMSLARGLDYYTGAIYEAVLTGGGTNVGSIGGGGRYDNLVGMFSSKQVPCVGVCVGIERVFNIMEERERAQSAMIRATQTEVMVASIGSGLVSERLAVAAELWAADIKAEYMFAQSPNMQKQLTHALESGIPLMVIFGGDELANKQLKIKNLATHDEVTIPRDSLVEEVRKILSANGGKGPTPVVVS